MPGLLIADDMPIIRRAVTRIASEEKLNLHPVIEAKNGVEALAAARQNQPDIVVMDIKMPVMDGLQAASMIRAELPAVKIIMLTAHDDFAFAQKALRLGAVDYLLKPIRPANLREVLIRVHAQLHREQQQKDQLAHVNTPLEATDPIHPAAENTSQVGRRVNEATAYIREHMSRSDLSLAEVAQHVNLSPSHLAFLLKERLGLGYSAYLTHLRMEQAKQLLSTTQLNIATVAERVGYATAGNFYRLFRRETHMTPAEFRHSAKTNPPQ